MSRRFTVVTLALTALVAFLVGAIVAGGFLRPTVAADTPKPPARVPTIGAPGAARNALSPLVNFADVVERINSAVVNIDATSRGPGGESRGRRRLPIPESPELFDGPRREAQSRVRTNDSRNSFSASGVGAWNARARNGPIFGIK